MSIRSKDSNPRAQWDKSENPLQASARSITAILVFFLLAFGWSWTIGYAAAQAKSDTHVTAIALIASGFGPTLAAIVVVAAFSKGAGLHNWLTRCFNWRVGWQWFAFAFFAPPIVMLTALGIHVLLGGDVHALMPASHVPLAIANFGLVLIIGGPLGEEFGWRAYATSAFSAKLNWRAASLIIGVIWGVWHLPLFFMVGTAQSSMPIPIFLLNILAGSVLFGWLFERTQQSVLPAIVLHTSLNAWAGMLNIIPTAATGRPYALVTGLLVVVASALLIMPDRKQAQDEIPC